MPWLIWVAACGDGAQIATPTERIALDEQCKAQGRCQCLQDEDCSGTTPLCIDGRCVADPNAGIVLGGNGGGTSVTPTGGRGGAGGSGGGTSKCADGGEPAPEQCNGRDDDCDGDVDEDFLGSDGKLSTVTHCGQCGLECGALFANLAVDKDGKTLADASRCVAAADGFSCQPAKCASGYALATDESGAPTVCLPIVEASCQPCSVAKECGGGVAHSCNSLGAEGSFCFRRCDADGGVGCTGAVGEQGCCADGFSCEAVGEEKLCQPKGGSCRCSAATVGLPITCQNTGDAGKTTCIGLQTCQQLSPGVYSYGACNTSGTVDSCNGKDDDCNGTPDDSFTVGGAYTLLAHCGACGNDCGARWTEAEHHAVGKCDAGAGPDCAIDHCTSSEVGGAKLCVTDSDCAGDPVSTSCDPILKLCAKACSANGDCASGSCVSGYCSTGCGSDGACTALFGAGSQCKAGQCARTVAWTDFDRFKLNGCECPAIDSDTPLTFATIPSVPGAAALDRNCDGISGVAARSLFVREGASGTGTAAAPFGAIQDAIDAFNPALHDTILVATGTYLERVVLKGGVRVYGGYSEDFSRRDTVVYRTVLTGREPDWAQNPTFVGTLNAVDITTPTLLAGFTIEGYDVSNAPTSAGKASTAVFIKGSSAALQLTNNEIRGGRGGAGQPGFSGDPGTLGGNGQPGLSSKECATRDCATNLETQPGGAAGVNAACGSANACPGMEADYEVTQAFSGTVPAGCAYAQGGNRYSYSSAEDKYCKYDCTVNGVQQGANGSSGTSGTNGTGGPGCTNAVGSIVAGVWVPAGGGAGTPGTPGIGGQGGLAGGGVINQKPDTCTIDGPPVGDLGGSGGGGGAGGCGGTPGLAGQSGGASFAVFIGSAGPGGTYPTLTANLILRGLGGTGGLGGAGGAGGPGGKGGRGGLLISAAWCGGEGGAGGDGGFGGDGGGGGGGCGGPSFAVAGLGIPLSYGTVNQYAIDDATPTGGAKGTGGLAPRATPGSDGTDGAYKNVQVF